MRLQIGAFFPTRDISASIQKNNAVLVDLAENFTPDTFFSGLLSGQDSSRRRKDIDTQPSQNGWDPAPIDVYPAPGLADSSENLDSRRPVGIVFQEYRDLGNRRLLGHFETRYVAFLVEDLHDLEFD